MLEFRDVVVLKVGIEGQWRDNGTIKTVLLKIYFVNIFKNNEIIQSDKKMIIPVNC